MILNAYAVLDAFVALLRLGLVLPVVWLAVSAWRRWRAAGHIQDHEATEHRFYLLFLLAGLLLVLDVLAWPLFYLLLQSYVPEWPGVMCIYGVTRVGAGSVGTARFLPPLLDTLQVLKPLLVFVSGVWFVLHLVNRRTRTAPLTGRVLLGLLAAGLLAGADAAAELAYLVIPKKEEFLSTGCCGAAFDREDGAARFIPSSLAGEHATAWLYPAYYAVNAVVVAALLGCARVCRRRLPRGWLAPLLAAAGAALLVDWVFLTEVAAPRLLDMPGHHCPYDLVSQAPTGVGAVVLFVGASLCAGWGCCAGWFARGPESDPALPGLAGFLFLSAAFGYAASVVVMSAGLTVA